MLETPEAMSSSSEAKIDGGQAPGPTGDRTEGHARRLGFGRSESARGGRSSRVELEAELGAGYLQRVESGKIVLPER